MAAVAPRGAPYPVRQGIANLHRPQNQTVAITLALGFGVFAVGTILQLESALVKGLALDESTSNANLVLFDIQRTGPSTGMPTRTQQGDLMLVAYASHGDTRHIALFPANPEECFRMAVQAFDLAERFQTPVFVVSDLDIGMNDWMVPRLQWDDGYVPDRGKVLTAADLEQVKKFSRYLDVDGDGIAARTLPGVHPKGAYFTRGSGHDKHAAYTEDAAEYQEVVDRLKALHQGGDPLVVSRMIERQTGSLPDASGWATLRQVLSRWGSGDHP